MVMLGNHLCKALKGAKERRVREDILKKKLRNKRGLKRSKIKYWM